MIRQITINCAERGYLLVRVRDEVRMVKSAYQHLYESSIAYGMKKALVATESKQQMSKRIETLEQENRALDAKTEEMEAYLHKRNMESTDLRLKLDAAH